MLDLATTAFNADLDATPIELVGERLTAITTSFVVVLDERRALDPVRHVPGKCR
jgi:hypothetical protein